MDDLVESGREIIERGSKSFAVAARLFDRETRAGAYLLYAWCRHCDDETDAQKLGWGAEKLAPEVVRARVAKIREQTARALAGEPVAEAVFRGLRQVVERYGIPRRYVFEHLAGFEMDAVGHEYRQLEDTLLYSYHVAGVVGIMMSHVMGADDEPTLDRAADLGIAFQLTNIARDVLDDVATGRVYLPADWLVQAGVPAAAVQAP
ncbi:MAG: phytoene/squalene synthase family protein, partial [Acidobacteriota bacterium]